MSDLKIYPWETTIESEKKQGVVVATDNHDAGNRVLDFLCPPGNILEIEKSIRVGPPLEFSHNRVAEINFNQCVMAHTAPIFDKAEAPFDALMGMFRSLFG